ncbi:MAG: hypothetical protein ACE5GC_03755 [Acidimicrobiia bacterium]
MQATGYFDVDHVTTGGDDQPRVWIDKTVDNSTPSFPAFSDAKVDSLQPTDTNYHIPFAIVTVDAVSAAGAVTYYLESDMFTDSGGTDSIKRTQFVALFVPTAYGSVADLLP